MANDGKKVFWLSMGILSGIGATICISELRKFIRKKSLRQSLSDIQDAINLDDLATLARSPNISLKRSAEQLILERAMKDKNLEYIINSCFSTDENQVLKGITVVGVIVKSSEFRSKLIAFNVLETLAYCLDHSINPGYMKLMETGRRHIKAQRVITSALFDLVCDEEKLKLRLGNATPTILSSIIHLMLVSTSKEVARWCIYVTHQLALCDALRPQLIESDVINKVSKVFMREQGDHVLMRLCLQTLVMCANTNEEEEIQALHEMAGHNIIPLTVTCLKADDSDLVYWATALIHEYSVKDLYRPQICAIPNIVKTLQGILSSSEAILQRVILRVISFLCVGDQDFRKKVLNCNGIFNRLTVCFASGDKDVVHWAVVLLHDLLLSGSTGSSTKDVAEMVINACDNVIKSIVTIADHKDATMTRVVAEVIGFFCSVDFPSEKLQKHIIDDGAIEAVLAFLQSSDPDLQLWSSALLLNISMSSDSIKEQVICLGGIKPLIEMAISESDQATASQSAKTLVMLGFADQSLTVTLEVPKTDTHSKITFNGKDYFFNKAGINICVLDFLNFKIIDVLSYDTGHDRNAASELVQGIAAIPSGCLVFLVCKDANTYMTFEAMEALKEIGIVNYNLEAGELMAYVGQKRDQVGEQIAIHHDCHAVKLQAQLSLGRYVNDMVLNNLLMPVIDVMMSTLASSAVSKVSELELLIIMARHDDHKQVMVFQEGFLSYLAELCWNISNNSPEYLREHPMFIAHCIGSLKIINSISMSEYFHKELLHSRVLEATFTLLYFINEVSLLKTNQTADQFSPMMSPTYNTESVLIEQSIFDAEISKQNKPAFSVSHTERPLPSFSRPEEVSFDERKSDTMSKSSSQTTEDFDDAFCTIVRLAITTIYKCMDLFEGIHELRDSLWTSGILQTLWCTLLNSNESTLAQVGLPIEALLNSLVSVGISENSVLENVVELDDRIKTAAVLLSADHLEAFNLNWTFESIRATTCVGRKMYDDSSHPDGWYYEVILKSNGILQIGWQTEDCRYGPEKGVGVGDNQSSCAFDGARCKVWNGPAADHFDNDYGTEWKNGDVLSCLLSWEGNVSFWLNGVDQGVAFQNMNTYLNWYPAASLAMDQHCAFNFGNKPFRYSMPTGYIAISSVTSTWIPPTENVNDVTDKEEIDEGGETSNTIEANSELSSERPMLSVSDEESLPTVGKEPITDLTSSVDSQHLEIKEDSFITPRKQSNESSTSTTKQSELDSQSSTPVNITPLPSFGKLNSEASSAPWLQFSPGESLSAECDTPSFPCFYFEAELKNAPSNVIQMGFFCTNTGRKILCDLVDDQLYFPKTSHHVSSDQENYHCPEVVGCGILWPAGIVFFTLDGVGTGQYYKFPTEAQLNLKDMFPYISCSRIRCNYGQQPFLFEGANFKEVRFAGANLLHAHGLSNEITSHGNIE